VLPPIGKPEVMVAPREEETIRLHRGTLLVFPGCANNNEFFTSLEGLSHRPGFRPRWLALGPLSMWCHRINERVMVTSVRGPENPWNPPGMSNLDLVSVWTTVLVFQTWHQAKTFRRLSGDTATPDSLKVSRITVSIQCFEKEHLDYPLECFFEHHTVRTTPPHTAPEPYRW
jgi:hypothetical protein